MPNILSVADGVGGWAEQGVDPAIYSKALCENIGKLANDDFAKFGFDPKRLLIDSVANNHHTGSSTCVIACLDQDRPHLKTVNLGDSGYMLLRKNGMDLVKMFRSKE